MIKTIPLFLLLAAASVSGKQLAPLLRNTMNTRCEHSLTASIASGLRSGSAEQSYEVGIISAVTAVLIPPLQEVVSLNGYGN